AIAPLVLPGVINLPESFAVVGMAAFFAAIVRAPLTGIVLIVEMTNTYEQMLPLLVACVSAYAIADWVMDRPIYEALLERDLSRDGQAPDHHGPVILECTVQEGARLEGQQVHEIGLPEACLLVALRRGLAEAVPARTTRLEAGDRLTAVIAPQATEALTMLRTGCASPHTRE